jgi:hypothetical protein
MWRRASILQATVENRKIRYEMIISSQLSHIETAYYVQTSSAQGEFITTKVEPSQLNGQKSSNAGCKT